jgi:hypothetical protein
MCTGITVANVDLTGVPMTLTMVDSSHVHLMTTMGITCDITFAVSGSTATATAGQSCMLMVGTAAVSVDVTQWTLTLSGDTLTSTLNGTATVSIVSCTPTSTGTAARVGGTDGGTG